MAAVKLAGNRGERVYVSCQACGLSGVVDRKTPTVSAARSQIERKYAEGAHDGCLHLHLVAVVAVRDNSDSNRQGGIGAAVVRMPPSPKYLNIWDSQDASVYATWEFNQRMDRITGFEKRAESICRTLGFQRDGNLLYLRGKQKLLEDVKAGRNKKWIDAYKGLVIADWTHEMKLAEFVKVTERQIRTASGREAKFQRDERRVQLLRLALKENAVEWCPADLSAEKLLVREYAFRPATVYDVTSVRVHLVVGDGDVFPAKFTDVAILAGEKP